MIDVGRNAFPLRSEWAPSVGRVRRVDFHKPRFVFKFFDDDGDQVMLLVPHIGVLMPMFGDEIAAMTWAQAASSLFETVSSQLWVVSSLELVDQTPIGRPK